MKISKPILITLFAFLLFGCTDSAPKDEAKETPNIHVANPEAHVKQTLVNMWDAIEKGDIDRYATYIHPDFTQWGETAKTLRVGKAAEVKAIKEWIEEPTKVHTEMKEPKVTIRGDVAWITYFWEDEGTSKGEPFASKGKSTRIFVKEGNKWLCIHGHYTLLENENK
ncbi:MAG: nuclear transport factor 2 family protein [Pyrinomonadaceae bacterium]|nr:nuclear transport factor 2 family protein [Pyrinomonadaceae bacterium]